MRRTCAAPGCRVRFTPRNSRAKFHSATCRQRAGRAAKKPAPAKKPPAKKTAAPKRTESSSDGPTSAADNHELVVALRQELETAKVLDTFEGQLAIELARRLVKPDSNASALSDKVRAARDEALGKRPDPGGREEPEDQDEDDEVTRARARREEARKAAGLT